MLQNKNWFFSQNIEDGCFTLFPLTRLGVLTKSFNAMLVAALLSLSTKEPPMGHFVEEERDEEEYNIEEVDSSLLVDETQTIMR